MVKRGLSGVVASVLIILLVIVGAAIVWLGVKNFFEEAGEDTESEISLLGVNVGIEDVYIDSAKKELRLSITRGADKANITYFKIVVTDDSKSHVYRVPPVSSAENIPGAFEKRTYTLDLFDLNPATIRKIEVYPISEISGEAKPGVATNYKPLSSDLRAVPPDSPPKVPPEGGPCKIISYSALVGHWTLDSERTVPVSGVPGLEHNVVDDSGLYKSDGIIYDFPQLVSGAPSIGGSAYSFDGVDDWIDLGLSTDNVMDEGTLAFWVKPGASSTGMMVGAPYGFEPTVANGKIVFSFLGSTLVSQGTLSTTTFDYVVITWASNGVKVFINGNKDIDSSVIKGPLNLNQRSLRIGTRENNNWFKGEIDDVMLFNIDLDDAQVEELFNGRTDFSKTITACNNQGFYNAYLKNYPDSFTDEQLLNYNVYALYGSQERNYHGRNKAIMGRVDALRSIANFGNVEFYSVEYFDRFMLKYLETKTFAPKWTDSKQGGGTWMPTDAMYAGVRNTGNWMDWASAVSYLQGKGWTWSRTGDGNYPIAYLPYNIKFNTDNTFTTEYRKMKVSDVNWRTYYLDFIKAHNDAYGYDGIMVERWPSKIYQYEQDSILSQPTHLTTCKFNPSPCTSGENLLSKWLSASWNPNSPDWNVADGHFAPPDEDLPDFMLGSIQIGSETKSSYPNDPNMKVWMIFAERMLTGNRLNEILNKGMTKQTYLDSIINNYDNADIIQIPQLTIDHADSGDSGYADLKYVADALRSNGARIYVEEEKISD